ncbi:MAG: dihydropteroate synthase [Ruminococcaceae bacterium]|nr:dihydropteroate synthase [Oscillospiraceae bacterium]
MSSWRIRGGMLSLERPLVMGILNVTPDSFADGGRYNTPATAAARAVHMVAEGAAVLDIGAQSTRPGATCLSAEEEWARLEPCLAAVRAAVDVPLSVDTFHPEVAAHALEAGAHIINDVSGSERNGMLHVAARYGAGIVCMRAGDVADRTALPAQTIADMHGYIRRIAAAATAAGVSPEALCLDIGVGFGSSTAGDLALIARLRDFIEYGFPLLVGASRKRVVKEVCLPQSEEELVHGSVALHTAAMLNGAHVVRVHDVAATVVAARAVEELRKARSI